MFTNQSGSVQLSSVSKLIFHVAASFQDAGISRLRETPQRVQKQILKQIAVEHAVVDRFLQMHCTNVIGILQIGNCSCHTQDLIMGSG